MADRRELDGRSDVHQRIQGIAFAWDNLDTACDNARAGRGIVVRGFKAIRKPGSWLVIVQIELEGQYFVGFKEASSSGDIGKVIRTSIEENEWKPDKYAGIDKKPSP